MHLLMGLLVLVRAAMAHTRPETRGALRLDKAASAWVLDSSRLFVAHIGDLAQELGSIQVPNRIEGGNNVQQRQKEAIQGSKPVFFAEAK